MLIGHTQTKIQRTKDGYLIGAAGDAVACERFLKWAHEGFMLPGDPAERKTFAENPDCVGIAVHPDYGFMQFNDSLIGSIEPGPYCAIGCAWEFVRGALAQGATAEQAVRLSIEHYAGCGGQVVTLTFEDEVFDEVDEPAQMIDVIEDPMETERVKEKWRQDRGL